MNSRFRKLAVESLEGRSVLSTIVVADFNGDLLPDIAAITSPNTITISLDNGHGGYDVSAIHTTPKNQPLENLVLSHFDGDADWDIIAVGTKRSGDSFTQYWLNNGDGTFDYLEPFKWKGPTRWWI